MRTRLRASMGEQSPSKSNKRKLADCAEKHRKVGLANLEIYKKLRIKK